MYSGAWPCDSLVSYIFPHALCSIFLHGSFFFPSAWTPSFESYRRNASATSTTKQTWNCLPAHSLPRHVNSRYTADRSRLLHQRHIQLSRDSRHDSPIVARELRTRCRYCGAYPKMVGSIFQERGGFRGLGEERCAASRFLCENNAVEELDAWII
jgi:hypothetical protein